MRAEEMVAAAIEVAAEGLAAGELPIGAVVVSGEEIVGRAFTQEQRWARMLAELP
jgi:tRNA(adenine34) deaminase